MEQSGTPCPFEGKIGAEALAQWKKYDKLRPDYDIYTKRLKIVEDKDKKQKSIEYSLIEQKTSQTKLKKKMLS